MKYESRLCDFSGKRVLQAKGTASAKTLRQSKFGIFKEKGGGHCGCSMA